MSRRARRRCGNGGDRAGNRKPLAGRGPERHSVRLSKKATVAGDSVNTRASEARSFSLVNRGREKHHVSRLNSGSATPFEAATRCGIFERHRPPAAGEIDHATRRRHGEAAQPRAAGSEADGGVDRQERFGGLRRATQHGRQPGEEGLSIKAAGAAPPSARASLVTSAKRPGGARRVPLVHESLTCAARPGKTDRSRPNWSTARATGTPRHRGTPPEPSRSECTSGRTGT